MDPFEHFLQSKPLTRQQRTILEAIVFLIRKGELPTVREVGALAGLRSPATVLKHLRLLEKAKLISTSGKSRGIRIADEELLRQILEEAPASESPRSLKEVVQAHLPHLSIPQRTPRLRLANLPNGIPLTAPPGDPAVPATRPGIPLVGAIAAGKPFESFREGFLRSRFSQDDFSQDDDEGGLSQVTAPAASQHPEESISIDPRMFASSGELIALRVEGDSMIQAGILDGDYVIIRRQNTVEEGEIAAVIIDGEGTLKRWSTGISRTEEASGDESQGKTLSLLPANDCFEPIEISEGDRKDVLVIGKYVGLVRGDLRFVS
jgi:SOS-response transcriptional repressor LexA